MDYPALCLALLAGAALDHAPQDKP
jgi:hypothetical protein